MPAKDKSKTSQTVSTKDAAKLANNNFKPAKKSTKKSSKRGTKSCAKCGKKYAGKHSCS